MDLPKIDNSNLLDKIYTILRERIINHSFKPNEKLSIPDLSKQLGVSRTPIRDALNRLEMDGLVKTVSKVGTFVNTVDIEDVLDAIDTRLMIELWVIEKFHILSKVELDTLISKLSAILETASEKINTTSLDTYLKFDYNMAFHMEFVKAGQNKRNVEIYRTAMNYHVLSSQYSLIKKEMVFSALHQHVSIVQALKENRFEAVKKDVILHLDDSKQRLLNELREK